MTTVQEAIDETLNEWLLTTYRPEFNQLQSDLVADPTITDVQVAFPLIGVGEGSLVAIDDELMYVVDTNSTSKRLTVVRGVRGSTVALHTATSPVEINPRFTRSAIRSAMKKEIRSWPRDLYRVDSQVLAVAVNDYSIDVAGGLGITDITRVLRLAQIDSVHTDRWIQQKGWRVDLGAEGPGSCRIQFACPLRSGANMNIVVGRKFSLDAFDDATELVDDVGLSEEMVEIVEMGAAWRLVAARETKRLMNEAQPDSRRAEEVPVQANSTWGRQLKTLRDERIDDEVHRLFDQFGIRSEG